MDYGSCYYDRLGMPGTIGYCRKGIWLLDDGDVGCIVGAIKALWNRLAGNWFYDNGSIVPIGNANVGTILLLLVLVDDCFD